MSDHKEKFKNYYIGLDVGTNSVGWAVTDFNYNILRHRGKDMWGVHLFDEASSAQERRMHRTARRRLERRGERLQLLRELLKNEINAIDPLFFQHLDESKFHLSDRTDARQKYSIFNDADYTDKNYHAEFPTVYHLRHELMNNANRKFDLRLIYLAIAHMLKSRGNFLNQNLSSDNIIGSAFDESFDAFVQTVRDILRIEVSAEKKSGVKDAFLKTRGITRRTEELIHNMPIIGDDDDIKQFNKQYKELIKLLAGGTVKLSNIFKAQDFSEEEDDAPDIDFDALASAISQAEEGDLKKISFSETDYDENVAPKLEAILGDATDLIESAKQLYDWSVLANILGEHHSISEAMRARYDDHHQDLKNLKAIVKQFCPEKMSAIFSDQNSTCNYCAWIGKSTGKNNKSVCSQEEFYKYLKKILPLDAPEASEIKSKIEEQTFLPKLRTSANGVIPYQLHQVELRAILKNAEAHYPFFKQKDESGLTLSEKIEKILTFRIPYFVGPLSDQHLYDKDPQHGHAWIVRNAGMERERILPWNFEKVVNLGECAERFIRRMTDKCTYLPSCDVLPKESLLYSEYMALNQLNNLKIDGTSIDRQQKKQLWQLCREQPSVSAKDITTVLHISRDALSGFDTPLKISLKAYHDFKRILSDVSIDIEQDNVRNFVEACILDITVFGDEKKELRHRLEKRMSSYGIQLTAASLDKICCLRYKDWGKFSREFLTQIDACFDKSTGEVGSILEALEQTTDNLMQLLSNNYSYRQKLDEYNEAHGHPIKFTYEDLVKPLYCSPAVKRAIWRTLAIVKDIKRITKHTPARIFVEMAREEGEKGKRTTSRKQQLEYLYSELKNDQGVKALLQELGTLTDAELRKGKDKLFLYFLQLGRCMYSGTPIDLTELIGDKNGNKWDIDHIYPRSKVLDDSLENRVLVRKELNHIKGDRNLCETTVVTQNARNLWIMLLKNKLLSREKYDRLTRSTPLTAEDLAGFINRQLVETRQSTKAVCECLRAYFQNNKKSESEGATEIVYSRAGRVSQFRKEFEFGKCREVNDLHHAKDAYLNIVVGNVFHTKFTTNPAFIFKNENINVQYKTKNQTGLFQCEIWGYDKKLLAWNPDHQNGSLQIVKKWMESSRILYTRYAYEQKGGFYNQNPLKAKDCGPSQIPLKPSIPCFQDTSTYGGYNNQNNAYFFLVEHSKRKKRIRNIYPIPIRLTDKIRNSNTELLNYCITPEPKGLGLDEPKIIISRILFNTRFIFDGFHCYLSGMSDGSLLVKHGIQLTLSPKEEYSLKKALRLAEDNSEHVDITVAESLNIYDSLLQKHNEPAYKNMPSSQLKTLLEGRDCFQTLSLEEQCSVLKNILSLFSCRVNNGTNLKKVRGKECVGKKKVTITSVKSALMINESPTGLTSQVIDLKKVQPK